MNTIKWLWQAGVLSMTIPIGVQAAVTTAPPARPDISNSSRPLEAIEARPAGSLNATNATMRDRNRRIYHDLGEKLKSSAEKNKAEAESGLAAVAEIMNNNPDEYTKAAAEAARNRLTTDIGNTDALLRTAQEMMNNGTWFSGRGNAMVTFGGKDWSLSDLYTGGTAKPYLNKIIAKIDGFALDTKNQLSTDIAAGEKISEDGGNDGIVMISHDTPGATDYSYKGNVHGEVKDRVSEPVTIAGTGDGRLTLTPDSGKTGEKTTAVMMGEHTVTNLSTGDSSVAIGAGATTYGSSVAIGKNAVSSRDSIALGNGSTAEGRYELSLGDSSNGVTRKITNMADGTSDTDGATIHNVKSEIADLDTKAQGYSNYAKDTAITKAKKYTDGAVLKANETVLNSANTYTDESSSRTLKSANTYTNHRSAQAENNAVARSNAYTDNRFGELRKSLQHTEKRLNAGIAGVTAISSIPYAVGNKFSYGIGAGNYQNGNAIAAGVQFRVWQSANVRLNVSWDSAGNNATGVGIAGGW
ncbi:YadA-like family protein [Salmonella enterica]|nr:YadA-like family protein [Salmonella enterica]